MKFTKKERKELDDLESRRMLISFIISALLGLTFIVIVSSLPCGNIPEGCNPNGWEVVGQMATFFIIVLTLTAICYKFKIGQSFREKYLRMKRDDGI